jgi:hypothetical protein
MQSSICFISFSHLQYAIFVLISIGMNVFITSCFNSFLDRKYKWEINRCHRGGSLKDNLVLQILEPWDVNHLEKNTHFQFLMPTCSWRLAFEPSHIGPEGQGGTRQSRAMRARCSLCSHGQWLWMLGPKCNSRSAIPTASGCLKVLNPHGLGASPDSSIPYVIVGQLLCVSVPQFLVLICLIPTSRFLEIM